MLVFKKIERACRAAIPRPVRHAVRDRYRRLKRAVLFGTCGKRRDSIGYAGTRHPGPSIRSGETAPETHPGLAIVVLLADPVERSRLAARLDGHWCRTDDPHDYVPSPGEYVHWPATLDVALSIPELRLIYLSLAHEPNDFLLVSRSIQPLPSVAATSLRDACVVRADKRAFVLEGGRPLCRLRGRVLRLLASRTSADPETSIDRLLRAECSHRGQHVFIGGPLGWKEPVRRLPSSPAAIPRSDDSRPTVLVMPALFAVGGVERNTVEILRELQSRYRFVIVTNEPHEPSRGSLHAQLVDLCEAVYDLGEAADFTHHADMLASLHAWHRFDCVWIVNGSSWLSGNLAVLRGIFADCAIVDQQVYDTAHGWVSCYRDPAIHAFDRHVAINSRIAHDFVHRFGVKADRVDLVYHAIDARKWAEVIGDSSRRALARSGLGVPLGVPLHGFIGRLTEQKRPLDFLDLARRSRDDGRPDRFIVVGDGPLADDCREFVRRHELSNVQFSGFVEDPADLLLALSGLVITSAYEGLPIVSLEAMAIGLPVLATDVGDLRVVSEARHTAVTFFAGATGEARYQEFQRWVGSLPGQAARAREAAEGVRAAFGADVIANRYDDVFRAAMAALPPADHSRPSVVPGRREQSSLSIVMPTFNRRDLLARVLDRYTEVARGIDHEIIVVDDGSTDGTDAFLAARARRDPCLRYHSLANGGPGRARNAGAAAASKEVVLFVGDDITPCDDRFLRTHARLHAAHPDVGFSVLGKVVWPSDRSLDITPVMRHIQGVGGEQFGYPHFSPYSFLDWRFFYTCNVSVKRSLVSNWETEGFSPDFTAAAFEDGEFAYRMSLRPHGLRLYYDPAAIGEHHHPHSVRTFLDRQFNAGTMASVLIAKHPKTAEVLGLARLIESMKESDGRQSPDQLPDLLSVIEGVKSLAMLIESFGGLGNSLWHTPFLQAVFELTMCQGFVVGESRRGVNIESGYRAILAGFLRRVEPIAATELPGGRIFVKSLQSRLAA